MWYYWCMKTFFIVILITFSFYTFSKTASAATGIGFGGLVTAVIPCTCSGGAIITYAPFFNNTSIASVGALYFQPPFSIPFMNYLVGVPSTYELGVYTPGVQAICLVGIPPACAPATVPVFGLIQYMGTSL